MNPGNRKLWRGKVSLTLRFSQEQSEIFENERYRLGLGRSQFMRHLMFQYFSDLKVKHMISDSEYQRLAAPFQK